MSEEGLKQDKLIVCNVLQAGQSRPLKKQVPHLIYLPQALGQLLPRLIDLDKPAAYAFAVYSSETNSFDMRTFTVLGTDRIAVGNRHVQAVKATDQAAAGAEAATLWLDTDGNLLRMQTADGMTMTPASRDAVLRRFPKAADK